MNHTPSAEELLSKIQKLERARIHLNQQISNLIISDSQKKKNKWESTSPGRRDDAASSSFFQSTSESTSGSPVLGPSALNLLESRYVNILESMGQSVHMFDLNDRIIYWNQMAQNLFGYTVAEALGKTAPDIIIGPRYSQLATLIIQRASKGETWSGEFPVRKKSLERFTVVTTLSPCCDENGTIFGVTCVCTDARLYRESSPQSSVSEPCRISYPHQPLQNAIVSKISILASKVKLKLKTEDANMDRDSDFPATDSNEGGERRPRFHKVLSQKAETWMGKKGISWPWKGSDQHAHTSDTRFDSLIDQELESGPQTSSSVSSKVKSQMYESRCNSNEAPGSSWCGNSSSWSTNSNSVNRTDINTRNLDVEISWDDLIIQEQIGEGSRGTVYHAMWYGSDVAVKILTKQEYPDDMILFFRNEISLMERLRHPNILLFMGAVVSPQHLCIVTEFLPRGSLFKLLQRGTTKLDWRRRLHMAMDIARGMNYLHHCQPPIIHRDLKSSNILVDKNWTLKVGDFGVSYIKHETCSTRKPQWMAPESLRNEQADEKSDVFSYGVVVWEITTGSIPWENLSSMEVIGAVGYMNQRLEIPNDVHPQWASLIKSCWSSKPQSRPTFQEILMKLKGFAEEVVSKKI